MKHINKNRRSNFLYKFLCQVFNFLKNIIHFLKIQFLNAYIETQYSDYFKKHLSRVIVYSLTLCPILVLIQLLLFRLLKI